MSFFKNKTKVFLVIATAALVAFMALSTLPAVRSGVLGNAFGAVIAPVQKGVSALISSAEEFFSYFVNMKSYERRNAELKEEISVLNAEVREMLDLKTENARLRSLLDLKERDTEFDLEAAEVIARDADSWHSTLTIDKGTNAGLAKNMPVITNDGVVGYIFEIGNSWAKVMTITDPASSVAAVAKRTGDSTVVEGDMALMSKYQCKMPYIPKESGLTQGDLVETSGLGGIYPAGLYIGKVISVTPLSDGMTQQAIIEPGAPLSDITHVMVICGK